MPFSFKESLYDESDPTYAPCVVRSKGIAYWRPPKKYEDCPIERQKLDGSELQVAAKARELTRAMVAWREGLDHSAPEPGTWAELAARYRADEFSPYNTRNKQNSRAAIDIPINKIVAAFGRQVVADVTYVDIQRWYAAARRPKTSDGAERVRSAHYLMTALRAMTGYGKAIKFPGAADAKAILSECKFELPAERKAVMTVDQFQKALWAAYEMKFPLLAIGLALQFCHGLRPVDVRGQWEKGKGSGIQRNGKIWRGLTWGDFSQDLKTVTVRISKTKKSGVAEVVKRNDGFPFLMEMLLAIPKAQRVGPVVVCERTRMPYERWGYAHLWRRVREQAGLPDNLWITDARAGAGTLARDVGASLAEISPFLQHSNQTTTQRYIRDRDRAADAVTAKISEHMKDIRRIR